MLNKREVWKRTLTGAGIVIVTIAAILISKWSFLLWLVLICVLGSREYFRLQQPPKGKFDSLISFAGGIVIAIAGYFWHLGSYKNTIILALIAAFLLGVIGTFIFRHTTARRYFRVLLYPVLLLATGVLFLGDPYDTIYILLPIILLWVNDIFAYLIGSTWGKNKIAPEISPGKSWEGTIGAGMLTLVVALCAHYFWPGVPFPYALLAGLLIPYIGLAGDLFESRLKRRAGVKDSGNLLPGHGGILDRYDSFIFVLPVAAILYFIFVV